ncbi:MAG: hypothetical protein MRY83_23475 [Flavobacteriales bacterium]|nr:hypothetical protein [Flavobacteriales bacterium]
MNKSRIFISILIFLFCTKVKALPIDQLAKIYGDENVAKKVSSATNKVFEDQVGSIITFYDAIQHCKNNNNLSGIAYTHALLSYAFRSGYNQNLDSAFKHSRLNLIFAEKANSLRFQITAHSDLGNIHYFNKNLDSSLYYLRTAYREYVEGIKSNIPGIKISEASYIIIKIADIFNSVGQKQRAKFLIDEFIHNYNDENSLYSKYSLLTKKWSLYESKEELALYQTEIAEAIDFFENKTASYNRYRVRRLKELIAQHHFLQGDWKKSEEILLNLIDTSYTNNFSAEIILYNRLLGNFLVEVGEVERGQKFLEKAIKTAKESEFVQELSTSYLSLAKSHFDNGEIKKADRFLNEILNFRDERLFNAELIEVYLLKSKILKLNGDFPGSLNYLEHHLELLNSKDSTKAKNAMSVSEMERTLELQNQQIYEHQKVASEERIKSQERLILALIAIIALIPVSYFLYAQRKKYLKSKLESAKKEEGFQKKIEQVNQTLESVKLEKENLVNQELERMLQIIEELTKNENHWPRFEAVFHSIYPNFNSFIQENFDNPTKTDLKIALLIKSKISNQQMCEVMHITDEGLKKAKKRLKSKVKPSIDRTLRDFIIEG